LFSSLLLLLNITAVVNKYELKEKISTQNLSVQRSENRTTLKLSSGKDEQFNFHLSSNDDVSRWLEAFAHCPGIKVDETILPSSPLKYDIGKVNLSDVSPLTQAEFSQMPIASRADQMKRANVALSETSLPFQLNHELEMFIPDADDNTQQSHKKRKEYSGYCLRPYPAVRGNYAIDCTKKSAVKMRKGNSTADQDDTEILRVIEAYCSTPSTRQANEKAAVAQQLPPQLIVAEDEKILVEELVGDQVVMQEKSLVDTVYVLRDQIGSMQKDISYLMKVISKEQKARRRLEEALRRGQPVRSTTTSTTQQPLATKNGTLEASD